jgi:hypothetical protein
LQQYIPDGKTLVILGDGASGNQWKREFRIAIAEALEWSESPYLLPLLEAFDEHERFAVVLTDRERSRIFVVHAERRARSATSRREVWGGSARPEWPTVGRRRIFTAAAT